MTEIFWYCYFCNWKVTFRIECVIICHNVSQCVTMWLHHEIVSFILSQQQRSWKWNNNISLLVWNTRTAGTEFQLYIFELYKILQEYDPISYPLYWQSYYWFKPLDDSNCACAFCISSRSDQTRQTQRHIPFAHNVSNWEEPYNKGCAHGFPFISSVNSLLGFM